MRQLYPLGWSKNGLLHFFGAHLNYVLKKTVPVEQD